MISMSILKIPIDEEIKNILENQRIILKNQDNLGMILNECLRELMVCSKRSLEIVNAIRDIGNEELYKLRIHRLATGPRLTTKKIQNKYRSIK